MRVQMTRKYNIVILLLIILPFNSLSAAPPLIEIQTEYAVRNVRLSAGIVNTLFMDNKIFFSRGKQCTVVDMDDFSIRNMDPDKEIFTVLGEQGEKLIVSRPSTEQYIRDLYLYNPSNDTYSAFELSPSLGRENIYLNHFIFSQYFVTKEAWGYTTKLMDLSSGDEILTIGNLLCDVSEDKQHFLISGSSELGIYNPHTKKWMTISYGDFDQLNSLLVYFISNELFIFRRSLTHNIYSIFNISGEEVLRFQYVHPDRKNRTFFRKIKDSVYGYDINGDVVSAIGEFEVLRDFGLIFIPTTGTANDSKVRIREYPLLDAKNLGYLTVGDKLEILDRSGIKVTIGDMEDYWYKIRRLSDNMEGWSYGAFIDVDEPPAVEDDGSPKSYRILDDDPTEVISYK